MKIRLTIPVLKNVDNLMHKSFSVVSETLSTKRTKLRRQILMALPAKWSQIVVLFFPGTILLRGENEKEVRVYHQSYIKGINPRNWVIHNRFILRWGESKER